MHFSRNQWNRNLSGEVNAANALLPKAFLLDDNSECVFHRTMQEPQNPWQPHSLLYVAANHKLSLEVQIIFTALTIVRFVHILVCSPLNFH
jgi:hypothetical protein